MQLASATCDWLHADQWQVTVGQLIDASPVCVSPSCWTKWTPAVTIQIQIPTVNQNCQFSSKPVWLDEIMFKSLLIIEQGVTRRVKSEDPSSKVVGNQCNIFFLHCGMWVITTNRLYYSWCWFVAHRNSKRLYLKRLFLLLLQLKQFMQILLVLKCKREQGQTGHVMVEWPLKNNKYSSNK